MTVNLSADGMPELLVAQPGGTFVTLLPQIHKASEELLEEGWVHGLYIMTVGL